MLRIWQGYTGFCVNCILKGHGILDVLSSEYVFERIKSLCIYAVVTKGSESNTLSHVFDNVLNIPRFQNVPGFWICWGSKYASKYARF